MLLAVLIRKALLAEHLQGLKTLTLLVQLLCYVKPGQVWSPLIAKAHPLNNNLLDTAKPTVCPFTCASRQVHQPADPSR